MKIERIRTYFLSKRTDRETKETCYMLSDHAVQEIFSDRLITEGECSAFKTKIVALGVYQDQQTRWVDKIMDRIAKEFCEDLDTTYYTNFFTNLSAAIKEYLDADKDHRVGYSLVFTEEELNSFYEWDDPDVAKIVQRRKQRLEEEAECQT